MKPDEILARLLYRDALMLILDKPAGLPVHAGPKGGPNLEHFLDPLRFGLPAPPALAHRLDRDTSGCLILGRHKKALRRLGKLFMAGQIAKTYWAVVEGRPPAPEGRIEQPLAKLTPKSGWKMIVDPQNGQAAITDYRLHGSSDGLSWLELVPHTGRTHQIRVHCQFLGCPVLGDPVYGKRIPPTQPLHLHARKIVVPLYPGKPPIEVVAPIPAHMRKALEACGFRES